MAFGSSFLAQTDRFPDTPSGEPWGDREIVIDLAGGPYQFSGLSRFQHDALADRFGLSVRTPGGIERCAVQARLFRLPHSEFPSRGPSRPTQPQAYRIEMDQRADEVRLASDYFLGHLRWDDELEGTIWAADNEQLITGRGFENFLRVLIAYRLLACGGLLLHCASVAIKDKAFVFPGRSGAGKTTVSRLAMKAGHEVLSDDLNALILDHEQVSVERLPFAGTLGRRAAPVSGRYPVAGLCALRKSISNGVGPLSSGQAFALLYANSPFVNADPYRESLLSTTIEKILALIPARLLAFRRKGGFWDLLGG